MKESIITLAVCTFMAFSMLVNCNSRAEKVKHEQREEAIWLMPTKNTWPILKITGNKHPKESPPTTRLSPISKFG